MTAILRTEFSLSELRGSDRKLVKLRTRGLSKSRAGRLVHHFDGRPFHRPTRHREDESLYTLARTKADRFLEAYDCQEDVDTQSGQLVKIKHLYEYLGEPARTPDDKEAAFEHVVLYGPRALDRLLCSSDGKPTLSEWLLFRDTFEVFRSLHAELEAERQKVAKLEDDLKQAEEARDEAENKLEEHGTEPVALAARELCAALSVFLSFEGVDTPPERRALHALNRALWDEVRSITGGPQDPTQAANYTLAQLVMSCS